MSDVKSTIYQRGDGQMIVTTGPKTCCFGSKRTAAEFIAMYQEEQLDLTARLAEADAALSARKETDDHNHKEFVKEICAHAETMQKLAESQALCASLQDIIDGKVKPISEAAKGGRDEV